MKNTSPQKGAPAIRGGTNTPHQRSGFANTKVEERARQLADIEANNDEDAAEIAASDAFKEFPPTP